MKRIVLAALIAAAIVPAFAGLADAGGRNKMINLPILKGPVHRPYDKDGYRFACDARGYCGNWNIGMIH